MNKIPLLLFLAIMPSCFAQNDTSTPYSLFGLGVENKTATGGLTGLGNTGIAQRKANEINIYNPASLGGVQPKTFLYEFGFNGTYSTIKTSNVSESTTNSNISHVVMAFPIKKNIGMSVGLLPYTKVGYEVDIENFIGGSDDIYLESIIGSGGLSKVYWATGINLNEKLALGVDLSYLFGTVNQETQLVQNFLVSVSDANYYNGFKFKAGLQYELLKLKNKEVTLGAVVELPTNLSGSQERFSYRMTTSGTRIVLDDDEENDLDDFELPLMFGLGVTSKLNQSLTASFDFKKMYWDNTTQTNNNESYTNQTIYALGAEYTPFERYTYWGKVKYRLGFNYNTGFLNISNQKIDSYFASFGLGLPLSNSAKLNVAYSYGREGTVSNGLIEENFHKITINLSFIGNWFNKSKYY